jgi:hypothetical protein
MSYSKISDLSYKEERNKFNLAKMDWRLYYYQLYDKRLKYSDGFLESLNVSELNNLVKKDILETCHLAIPKLNPHTGKIFPKKLLKLIYKRKELKKSLKKKTSAELKASYNNLTGEIKKLSSEFYENKWKTLLSDISFYPVPSRTFLIQINKINSSKSSSNLTYLNCKKTL